LVLVISQRMRSSERRSVKGPPVHTGRHDLLGEAEVDRAPEEMHLGEHTALEVLDPDGDQAGRELDRGLVPFDGVEPPVVDQRGVVHDQADAVVGAGGERVAAGDLDIERPGPANRDLIHAGAGRQLALAPREIDGRIDPIDHPLPVAGEVLGAEPRFDDSPVGRVGLCPWPCRKDRAVAAGHRDGQRPDGEQRRAGEERSRTQSHAPWRCSCHASGPA
jgi:hypothetical protein